MKKFLLLCGLCFCIVLCFHAFWLSKGLNTNDSAFDHSVAVALYEAADNISERVVVEKRSSNFYYVKANTSVSTDEIDTLIRKEFSKREINQDYEIGIYNAADDSLIHGKYVSSPTLIPENNLPLLNDDVQKNFAVLFPSKTASFGDPKLFWIEIFIVFVGLVIGWSTLTTINKTNNPQTSKHRKAIGSSIFDCKNQMLYVNDKSFKLTHKESQLIDLFFQKPDEVISRDEFLVKVWEQDGFFVARSMDVFISRIRKYLKNDPSLKIENLRSIGYRLVTQCE